LTPTYEYPAFPVPFVENDEFSPMDVFDTFVKTQVAVTV
jgi:hypothetical protein